MYLTVALCTATAVASEFAISPVVLELPAARTAGVVKIINNGVHDISLQLRAFDWLQNTGQAELSVTHHLIISPPLVTIPPKTTQTIRVISTRPAEETELAYRILVDEIPLMSVTPAVNFKFRISMPVFIAPTTAHDPKLIWTITGGSIPVLNIVNSSNRRNRLLKLKLTLPGGKQITPSLGSDPYILAGATRRYVLKTGAPLAVGTPVNMSAAADTGPIDSEIIVTP